MRSVKVVFLLGLVATLLATSVQSSLAFRRSDIALGKWGEICAPIIASMQEMRQKVVAFNEKGDDNTPEEVRTMQQEYARFERDLRKDYQSRVQEYREGEIGVLAAMLESVRWQLKDKSQQAQGEYWFGTLPKVSITKDPEANRLLASLLSDSAETGRQFLKRFPEFVPFTELYQQDEESAGKLALYALYREATARDKDVYPVTVKRARTTIHRSEILDANQQAILDSVSTYRDASARYKKTGLVFVGAAVQMRFVTHSHTVAWRWLDTPQRASWSKKLYEETKGADGIVTVCTRGVPSLRKSDHPFFQKGKYKVWPSH